MLKYNTWNKLHCWSTGEVLPCDVKVALTGKSAEWQGEILRKLYGYELHRKWGGGGANERDLIGRDDLYKTVLSGKQIRTTTKTNVFNPYTISKTFSTKVKRKWGQLKFK